MNTILDNMRVIFPMFAFTWMLFLALTLWRPQRFRNSFVLMAALFFTVFMFTGLFGKHMGNALLITFLICLFGLFLVPVLLVINGITMMKKESVSFANILSLLLGIFIGVGEISLMFSVDFVIQYSENDLWATILTFVGFTVFYFSALVLSFVLYMLSIQIMPHRMKFDYVIIHGCGLIGGQKVSRLLANRLDTAINLYQKCKEKPILIPSGGKGADEMLSEAEAMQVYLLEHGIPSDHILMENQSATTLENLRNSQAIIKSRGKAGRIALVSSNYHVYRCLLYSKELKMKCIGVGAKVAWYYWPSAVIREFVAVFTRKPHIVWILCGYLIFIGVPFGYSILSKIL